jgi:hypothetical protein
VKRRQFIAGLGSAAVWSPAVRAQQRVPVIGGFHAQTPETYPYQGLMQSFFKGLTQAGYEEGQNVLCFQGPAELGLVAMIS